MTKLASEWVRTSDPVIRSPALCHPHCAMSRTNIQILRKKSNFIEASAVRHGPNILVHRKCNLDIPILIFKCPLITGFTVLAMAL